MNWHTEAKPAFELTMPDGHIYRIWANGKTEGFPEKGWVNNRIPVMIGEAIAAALDKSPVGIIASDLGPAGETYLSDDEGNVFKVSNDAA